MVEGQDAEYLDLKVTIKNCLIETDVNSMHCHSYLPKHSCHPPQVFKGLLIGVGTRLRMLCSVDYQLADRLVEYAGYFAMAGWSFKKAHSKLKQGASKHRKTVITQPRKRKPRKIAWVTTYDPRLPSKSKIIQDNLHLLYSDNKNKKIFPEKMTISAERKRKNLGDIFKPTVPRRFPRHGPAEKPGFYTCSANRCDTCLHSYDLKSFQCPWDGRNWVIKQHITCTYYPKRTVYSAVFCPPKCMVCWFSQKPETQMGQPQI